MLGYTQTVDEILGNTGPRDNNQVDLGKEYRHVLIMSLMYVCPVELSIYL